LGDDSGGAGTPPKTALTVFGCAPKIPVDLNPRTVAASAAVVPPFAGPPRIALTVAAAASLSRSRAAYRSLRSRRSAPTGIIALGSGASGVIVALLADVAMLEADDAAFASGASSPSFALHQNRCPSLQAVLWHSLPQYFAFRHRRHLANSRGYSSQRPQSTTGASKSVTCIARKEKKNPTISTLSNTAPAVILPARITHDYARPVLDFLRKLRRGVW
jgi:hypothetical protein